MWPTRSPKSIFSTARSRTRATPKGAAAAEVKRLSGGTSFPVLVVGDEVVVGFNKGRMTQLLGL